MKKIEEFDNALHYVHHLGFAGAPSNSIAAKQFDLCAMTDLLLKAAGGEYPYRVQFKTHKDEDTGFTYPYLGEFKIIRKDGSKWRLSISSKYFYRVDTFKED